MNRVLNVSAMVVSLVLFLICDQLNAAVVNITQGSTSGYTMTDGNTYVIQNSVTFSNATTGCSGISVESNSTVVIYVPKNVTLTATGANGEGRIGGGAGIRVPETSTLVLTGEGMVVATGGNAGSATDGENGGRGYTYGSYTHYAVAGAGGLAVTVEVAQERELAEVVVGADLRQMAMGAMEKMVHLWVRFMF